MGVENTPDSNQAVICDGIVVLPKEATLPEGWSWEAMPKG
jgi:hypothetical protein